VSVLPDSVSRALLAASKDSITVPAAVFSSTVPSPRWIASLKVRVMLLPTATAPAWLAGLKLNTVGATVSSAVVSSIGIVTMVGMALAMTDSGMTYALANGMKSVAGAFYPLVAPFIGVLGAFMTGSNTNSNILFGALQRDTATLLGISTTAVLAAQTTGGALGSMLAPAKIVVGCSTVGLAGQEGQVLRRGVAYGLVIAAVMGLVALVWVQLR